MNIIMKGEIYMKKFKINNYVILIINKELYQKDNRIINFLKFIIPILIDSIINLLIK